MKTNPLTFKQVKTMYDSYQLGMSLAGVGEKFGVDRRTVHYYFKQFNFECRKQKRKEFITYNGNKYTVSKYGTYRKTDGDRSQLHYDIWIDNGNTVPDGHFLIHKNGNKLDNSLENLMCVDEIYFRKYLQHKGHNQFTPYSELRHKSKSRYGKGKRNENTTKTL